MINHKGSILAAFDEIHKFVNKFDLDCINGCKGDCEDGAILLLPYENEYLSQKVKSDKLIFPSITIDGFSCGFIAEDEPHCIALGDDHVTCKLYPFMPVDCLTYPVFPKFNIDEFGDTVLCMDLYLSKFCPLHKNVNQSYIHFAKKIWHMVLPFISKGWMQFYNENIIGFFSKKDTKKV